MAEGLTTLAQLCAALPRCVGFIMLHLAASQRNNVLIHDLQGTARATAVAAVAMAVRSPAYNSVRSAYTELRTRREINLSNEMLDALEPVAEAISERFATNRRLLSQRGLLAFEHERLLGH